MLEIINLHAGYNGVKILNGIDLKVGNSEIVGIIGINGAGKSTILKCIFNLCEIYNGKILYNNKDITANKTFKLISQGLSYGPQGSLIFLDLTVKENLEIGGYIINDKIVLDEKIDKAIEFFPFLKRKLKQYAHTLSGGERQMLSLARNLIVEPRLLLLDEPSAGIASKNIALIFDKINEINQSGVAVIIVEQNINEIFKISHRIYEIDNGLIIKQHLNKKYEY